MVPPFCKGRQGGVELAVCHCERSEAIWPVSIRCRGAACRARLSDLTIEAGGSGGEKGESGKTGLILLSSAGK